MGRLWTSLAVPPVLAAVGGTVPYMFAVAVPVLIILLIKFAFTFSAAVSTRYRGSSLIFLNSSYVLGQIIIGVAVYFGACLLVFN